MAGRASVGLIAAIPQELAALGDHFVVEGTDEAGGFSFRSGRLDGLPVVAAESGIGKVNAAIVASLLATRGVCALVFSGVAGGLDPALGVGDVVIADRLIAHDYGAVIGGAIKPYQPGVPPLPGMPETVGYLLAPGLGAALEAALVGYEPPALSGAAAGGRARRPRILFGTVLTGDTFVNCPATRERLFREFGGRAVEMEGAAVAAVAERFAIPWVVVRALSDLAGADSHVDFPAFLAETAAAAAAIVRRIMPAVARSVGARGGA
jgi:adenosylhomocysteine nucleosidase